VATLALAMRDHIERALIATDGQIEGRGGAAELLDINPHTLRARMRKLGPTRANTPAAARGLFVFNDRVYF
jgi:hypothetical protein